MDNATFRIIDANINRSGEGLRVIEEIARMVLNDSPVTQQLKNLRHRLSKSCTDQQSQLLSARNSINDVGISLSPSTGKPPQDLLAIVAANSHRVQESLRVLEEISKLPESPGFSDSDFFKHSRFELYSIEKELVSRLMRLDKSKKITGLYGILDTLIVIDADLIPTTRQLIKGGAKIVQLRDKRLGKHDLIDIATRLKLLCVDNNVLFILNDYLDIALAVDADGLHVGQDDLPVTVARKILPVDKLIGCSVISVAQARQALQDGADYVAPGAVFATGTKSTDVVGLARVQEIRDAVSAPVVAIGGINLDNIDSIIDAGADAAAVISAVLQSHDIESSVRKFQQRFEVKHGQGSRKS